MAVRRGAIVGDIEDGMAVEMVSVTDMDRDLVDVQHLGLCLEVSVPHVVLL